MSQVFSHEFIKSKLTSIIDISDRLIDEMEKLNSKKMEEKDVIKTDIYLLLQQIFGTVVIKCFFGEMELGKIDG